MALQKQVTVANVVPEGAGGTLTLNLKCWAEGDDPETDMPVLDIDRSEYVKKGVEGVTAQQLINRATATIGAEFQKEIDRYLMIETITDMVNTTAVKNGLVG